MHGYKRRRSVHLGEVGRGRREQRTIHCSLLAKFLKYAWLQEEDTLERWGGGDRSRHCSGEQTSVHLGEVGRGRREQRTIHCSLLAKFLKYAWLQEDTLERWGGGDRSRHCSGEQTSVHLGEVGRGRQEQRTIHTLFPSCPMQLEVWHGSVGDQLAGRHTVCGDPRKVSGGDDQEGGAASPARKLLQ